MAEGNICCCDLTPHPDDKQTYTDSKAEGKRYQLISGSCHVESIEVTVHTSAETDSTIVKFFTTPEPSDTGEDVNMWNLVVGKSEGSSAWTPDQFAGTYFEDGVYVDVMSVDTTATSLNMNGLSLSLRGLPLAVVTFFRMTSRVLMYGYFST